MVWTKSIRVVMCGMALGTGLLLASGTASAQESDATVEVTRFDTVSLNFQNEDLLNALELLAAQSERNIVPSAKVSGKVTANLFDVTFHEALNAVLQQNGCGFIEKGNFIYVYTLDELKKIQEAEREMVHRIFRLNYINGADIEPFLKPLQSLQGKIVTMEPVEAGIEPSLSDAGGNSNAQGEVMLVRDYPENIEAITRLVMELDTAPSQVLIEATILQARLNEDLAFGVDLAVLADIGINAASGGALGVAQGVINGAVTDHPGAAISSTVGNVASGKGGVKVGILTHNVAGFIRALDEVTDTTIMANPKVMTLNRQRADVHVGLKLGYLSTTSTATSTTQTVQFLETGTQLTVRPFVAQDGTIRLELRPSVSIGSTRDLTAGATLATVPDEQIQELTSNVMVRDGQTVVLGGLFQEETTITRKQVPGLGGVPVAGWAFRGKDDSVIRNEVIFLITPHIVSQKALAASGNSAAESIERLRIGSREGLLPWSRTKMTSAHLRESLNAMAAGDHHRALLEVDMALSLDPTMVEARRLKEKLTGARVYWPSDSNLNDVVDMMVDDQAGRRDREMVDIKPDPAPSLPVAPAWFTPGGDKPVLKPSISQDFVIPASQDSEVPPAESDKDMEHPKDATDGDEGHSEENDAESDKK